MGLLSSSWLFYSQCFVLHPSVSCHKLRSQDGTLNQTLYLIHTDRSNSVNHNQVQVFNYSKYSLLFTCSQDWTCNLQMNSLHSLTKCLYSLHHMSCWTIQSVLTYEILLITIMYDFFFFTLAHISKFLFINPFWLLVPISYSSLYLVNLPGHWSTTSNPVD